jgi:hypothetical protein
LRGCYYQATQQVEYQIVFERLAAGKMKTKPSVIRRLGMFRTVRAASAGHVNLERAV